MADKQEQAPATPEKKVTHTVISNTDLDAVLADARGEKISEKPIDDQPPPAETKVEVKPNGHDDEEDGLTQEQREDPQLTEKMKRAIGKKHRQFKDAEEFATTQFNEKQLALRKADQLERENQRLREQLNPPKVEEAPKKPVKTDFKTDEEFIEAMADYKAGEKLREKEVADHKRAFEERQRELIAFAGERIAIAEKLVPDFKETVDVDIQVPTNVAGYMAESEMIAELSYYLAKNPEVLENISKMTPPKQLVAIGKIEAILKPFGGEATPAKVEVKTAETPSQDGKPEKATPSTNAKPASKARVEPIKPLDTGSASQVEKPESEMTYAETRAAWEKRHKVKFNVRRRH